MVYLIIIVTIIVIVKMIIRKVTVAMNAMMIYAATVAPGTDVSFPRNGSSNSLDIIRTGPSSFNLTQIGTYQIFFQVGVTEAGQLLLT